MAKKVREEFTVFKDTDGVYHDRQNKDETLEAVKLHVRRPNYEDKQKADFEYQKTFNKLLKEGIMPRLVLDKTIRANGEWNKEEEAQEVQLAKAINSAREKLKRGNIKLSDAVKLAKQSIDDNFKYIQLNMNRNEILNNSAESLAEQARFNYLTSAATVYNDSGVEKKFFKNYEDFLHQDSLGNPVTYVAGATFNRLINNFGDNDFRADWPEYKFLKKYGFVNEKFEYVNKDGKLIDREGNVIEEAPTEETQEGVEAEFLPD